MTSDQAEIERRGGEMLRLVDRNREPVFTAASAHRQMMDWAMRNESLKAQLFRFVDVLPSLRSSGDVVEHLREYFNRNGAGVPALIAGALRLSSLAPYFSALFLRRAVSGVARQFIAGKGPREVVETLRRLHRRKIGFTVDLLGEAVVSEGEADTYAARCLEMLEVLAAAAREWATPQSGELFPAVNLSVKISALYSQISTADPEDAIAHLSARLRPILRRARELGAFVNFDMESYAMKNVTLELFKTIFTEPEFAAWPHAGIVIQAYLRDSERDLRGLIEWGRARGTRFAVRLVKGAYWDYEKIRARQNGWPCPVFLQKARTDAHYELLTGVLLESVDVVTAAFGSHNVRSIAHAQVRAERLGVDRGRYEFQLLYGMAGPIVRALVETGYRVREYCPVGELLPGMSYLVRRLIENTSNEGFLRAKFAEHAAAGALLRDPAELVARAEDQPVAAPDAFENAPLAHFVHLEVREQMRAALREARARFGEKIPLLIDGQKMGTSGSTNSINPASPDDIVGAVSEAGIPEAELAVKAARRAFEKWGRAPVSERAGVLERAAAILERRRFELAALEVFEVGKPWLEADADVREAIDMCLFYARQMRRLGRPRATQIVPGEESFQHYLPRGVALVIAPWNFPLAILCGMTAAALVAGNTVILKPAEQSAVCGSRLAEIFIEAGAPAGVLNFLPGDGAVIGAHLVQHPGIDLIAFTGSREVGLKIFEEAGKTRPGQRGLKHVICEMGGKNAAIVDADAELDEAIVDCVYSAFGYQGQKCSALSRLILLEANYDAVMERLVAAASSLRFGPPEEPGITVGPVIDQTAHRRILDYIELGKTEAKLAYQATAVPPSGYFVPPTIFTDAAPAARIAREEIFGPVLTVFKVKTLYAAIALANDSDYALTAGFFSRSPANIDRARAALMAGNVYINRSCTGAVVGRHPFGGFKMSGGGTKAGGEDYLLHFLLPRVVTENVMRRGFAPE